MKEKQIEFLYQSISDTQATIRAIDVKIGFLFVIIFLPLTAIEGICKAIVQLWASPQHFGFILIITAILWCFSVYVLFRSLTPITDINKHMIGTIPDDTFYAGGMPIVKINKFFSIGDIRANQDVQSFLSTIPQNEQDLLKELASEKMKISLIRNVKNLRVSVCTNLTLGWLTLGMILSTIFYFGLGV